MKKLLALLLALMMVFSLAACKTDSAPTTEGDPALAAPGGDVLTQEELDDLENALDILESLKSEGWDENDFGAYIYDVYAIEDLPECFPKALPEGTVATQTKIKDYQHDTYGERYEVGRMWYESHEDYKEYNASFYCTWEQLDELIADMEAMGLVGGRYSGIIGEDSWIEYDFGGNGWYMYIFFNTNDDNDGTHDGHATLCATSDLWDLPESFCGIPLPQVGVVDEDYSAGVYVADAYDFNTGDTRYLEIPVNGGTLPGEEYSWWIYFEYFGTDADDARAHAGLLQNEGWTLEWDSTDDDGSYNACLLKDGVYASCVFDDGYMMVGFSDMSENLFW